MSSSRRVAMTSAMAGCRARRLDSNLRGDRVAAALAPRVNGLCRSVLLAVMGNLAIPRRSESHAFDVVNCAGVRPAGSQRRTALAHPLYRTRFFGHKFELSGLLQSGFLPGDTCVVRTAYSIFLDEPFGIVTLQEDPHGGANDVDVLV